VTPQRPEDVTPEWLTAALQRSAPGLEVVDVVVETVRHATNLNGTIRIRHDGGDAFPNRLFVKLPPLDPERRARLDWATMGRRECGFYRDLAPELDVQTPQVFVANIDDESGEFCLVMECVGDGSTQLPDVVAGLPAHRVAVGLEALAALHARFESATERERSAPWLGPSGRTSDYGARLLRAGIDRDPVLPRAFVAIAERYIVDRDLLQDAWDVGPTTILHGDVHIGNVFLDADDGLGFFDWGLMAVGSAMRDVSYAIAMLLSPEDRREHEESLLRGYLDRRNVLGAAALTFEDAWFSHRLQVAYCVVASCQSIALPDVVTAGRRAFADEFVRRASAAVADLDAFGALDEFSRR
jgi:hypothetical protein